jgi:hypothetical protein
LLKLARVPVRVVAATVTTPVQLPGVTADASMALLPAATTMAVPRPIAALMAVCSEVGHGELPPSDRLSTRAGVALAGTPATAPPDPHTIASVMSEK